MIYGFYFRFYKLIHNEKLSILLASLANFAYAVIFRIKKLFCKNTIVNMDAKKARELVNSVYSKPDASKPIYNNMSIDDSIDLSIIVPVYNYADLIEKNIQSILNQKTKYTYEAIFVDDGSTDGARDILDKYRDCKNVKVIFQNNMGIAGARNTGINNAVGKYIMFVDCDDIVHDDIVEKLLNRAYGENCDIVMCAHNLVKEKDGRVIETIPNVYPNDRFMKTKSKEGIMNYAGLPWAKVYKHELFFGVRFFPGYWYEDTIVLFLLFTQCKKFSYIPSACYEYKWYEKNFSHVQNSAKNVKSIDRYYLLVSIIEQYKKIGLPVDETFYKLLIRHLSIYYYPSISKLDRELVEAMFVLANELLKEYKPKTPYKLPYILRITEKAILSKNIDLWKLAVKYQ